MVFAIVSALFGALVDALRPRASLLVETLVLRQQLAVLKRARPRPPVLPIDRAFWVVVSRVWSRWADGLAIVKPATAIGWHRRGFARFWAWKSRPVGRPPLAPQVVAEAARRSASAAVDDMADVPADSSPRQRRDRLPHGADRDVQTCWSV